MPLPQTIPNLHSCYNPARKAFKIQHSKFIITLYALYLYRCNYKVAGRP